MRSPHRLTSRANARRRARTLVTTEPATRQVLPARCLSAAPTSMSRHDTRAPRQRHCAPHPIRASSAGVPTRSVGQCGSGYGSVANQLSAVARLLASHWWIHAEPADAWGGTPTGWWFAGPYLLGRGFCACAASGSHSRLLAVHPRGRCCHRIIRALRGATAVRPGCGTALAASLLGGGAGVVAGGECGTGGLRAEPHRSGPARLVVAPSGRGGRGTVQYVTLSPD